LRALTRRWVGKQAALIDEAACAEPTDLYGAMHIARELMMKQSVKMPVAVLRPTLIYGAGDPHNSYGPNRLRRMAHKDRRITLFGAGEETRDHIYIDDAVALIELVLRHRSSGVLNLATGRSVSYAELAKLVAAQCPYQVDITGTPRHNPVTHRAFDVTALQRSFPTFTFTPLEEGLAKAEAGEPRLPRA
jgi:UDP-glucose 4-epimerase